MPLLVTTPLNEQALWDRFFWRESQRGRGFKDSPALSHSPRHINSMFLFRLQLLLQQLGMFVISVKLKVKPTFILDKLVKDFFLNDLFIEKNST